MLLENDYFTLSNKGNGRFSLKIFLCRESNMENRFKSVFDIIGPVMIGPSSSHTAGAVAIGREGNKLFGEFLKRLLFIIMVLLLRLIVDMVLIMQLQPGFWALLLLTYECQKLQKLHVSAVLILDL